MTHVIKPTIRVRAHPGSSDTAEPARLITDAATPTSKKRQPNSGSWKKGMSPNPKGRPKGAKGLKAITRKVLSEKVTVRGATGPRKVRLLEGLMRKEVELAVGGDWRARKTILELGRWAFGEIVEALDEGRAPAAAELTPTGQAILDMYAEEVREQARAAGDQLGKEA